MSFFVFTGKLIRFWILQSDWVTLNLYISRFVIGLFTWKSNCYYIFTDVFVAVAINIHDTVSFNIECFKNLLSPQYHLLFLEHNQRKQIIKKIITFDSGNYLNM